MLHHHEVEVTVDNIFDKLFSPWKDLMNSQGLDLSQFPSDLKWGRGEPVIRDFQGRDDIPSPIKVYTVSVSHSLIGHRMILSLNASLQKLDSALMELGGLDNLLGRVLGWKLRATYYEQQRGMIIASIVVKIGLQVMVAAWKGGLAEREAINKKEEEGRPPSAIRRNAYVLENYEPLEEVVKQATWGLIDPIIQENISDIKRLLAIIDPPRIFLGA